MAELYTMLLALERWKLHVRDGRITFQTMRKSVISQAGPIANTVRVNELLAKYPDKRRIPTKDAGAALCLYMASLARFYDIELAFVHMLPSRTEIARALSASEAPVKSGRISRELWRCGQGGHAWFKSLKAGGDAKTSVTENFPMEVDTFAAQPLTGHTKTPMKASTSPDEAKIIPPSASAISQTNPPTSSHPSHPKAGGIVIKTDISIRAGKVTFAGVLSLSPADGADGIIVDVFAVTDAHLNDQRFGPTFNTLMRTNTNLAEAYAVLLALQRWRQDGQDRTVICFSDNLPTVEALQECVITLALPASGEQAVSDKGSESTRLTALVGMATVDLARRSCMRLDIKHHSRIQGKLPHMLSRGDTPAQRVGLPANLSQKLLANDVWFSEYPLR